MARRKLSKRHIRNIQKSRNTYMVSIPVDLIRAFGWRERQKVEVRQFGKERIIISDWKK